MNAEIRNEIVRRRQGGASMRRIARDLGLAQGDGAERRSGLGGRTRRWGRPSVAEPAARPGRSLRRDDPATAGALSRHHHRCASSRSCGTGASPGGLTIVRERVLELRPATDA